MKKETSVEIASNITKFIELLEKGLQAWVEAGRIVTESLEADPDFAEKVHKQRPEISEDTVYAFDRIGRKVLHPKLVISDAPGSRKLRRLSYHLQEKYVEQAVPLLIKSDSGDWQMIQCSVFNLTSDQSSQVFANDHIRSDAEQRAWLEDTRSKAMVTIDQPYRVSGRKLIVMQPCQLNAKQLAMILSEME